MKKRTVVVIGVLAALIVIMAFSIVRLKGKCDYLTRISEELQRSDELYQREKSRPRDQKRIDEFNKTNSSIQLKIDEILKKDESLREKYRELESLQVEYEKMIDQCQKMTLEEYHELPTRIRRPINRSREGIQYRIIVGKECYFVIGADLYLEYVESENLHIPKNVNAVGEERSFAIEDPKKEALIVTNGELGLELWYIHPIKK